MKVLSIKKYAVRKGLCSLISSLFILGLLGLDFLDDHFKRSGNKLSWEGSINEVPYTIVLNFPASIDNCHAHVWWTEED